MTGNNGTLDKFLGDGLMATFGTPIETADDPQNSFRCAMAMTAQIGAWNERRKATGKEPLQIGIGIHYGPCMLGDIGGESRMEFAVIGDTVNMASRVEAKTRDLGVDIAITEALYDRLKAQPEGLQERIPGPNQRGENDGRSHQRRLDQAANLCRFASQRIPNAASRHNSTTAVAAARSVMIQLKMMRRCFASASGARK